MTNQIINNIVKCNLSTITCDKCNYTLNILKVFKKFIDDNQVYHDDQCKCERYQEIKLYNNAFSQVESINIIKYINIGNNKYSIQLLIAGNQVESIISLEHPVYSFYYPDQIYRTNGVPFSNLSNSQTTLFELETIITLL